WPGVMAFCGWRAVQAAEIPDQIKSLGAGLLSASILFFAMEFIRQTCCKHGLAEAHFRWRSGNLKIARRNIAWLMPIMLPMVVIALAVAWSGQDTWTQSLARAAFMIQLVAISVFNYRLLRPLRGIVEQFLVRQRDRLLERTHLIWYPAAVLLPLCLATLAALGYFYTATHLARFLFRPLCLVWGVPTPHPILIRWVYVAHRRLSVEEAHKRREAAAAARPLVALPDGNAVPAVAPEPQVDLSQVNDQTRKLLRTLVTFALVIGGWLIWEDVPPRLGLLHIELWTHEAKVTEMVKDPEGRSTPHNTPASVPVPVGDLLLALVVLAVTFIAARNIPGLMEISILRRLPFEPGGRYAITTIGRYIITVV